MSKIECREFVEEVPICRRVCNLSTAEDESAAFLEAPLRNESKNSASSLKRECNSEVVIKASYQSAHMGEPKVFTQEKMSGYLIIPSIWDPGIVAIKMLSRISPLVSMDVEDYWCGNMDVAAILGKDD